MKILLTSTSFRSTKGKHQQVLEQTGMEVDFLGGPLKVGELLPIIGRYDGAIIGDDEFSRKVLEKGSEGKLKVLSKYGMGLDKVDLVAAKEFKIDLYNARGVNCETVAEHTMALILSYAKNIPGAINHTKRGQWIRPTGFDLKGKQMAIIGLGRIGKEVARRCHAFGMLLSYYDLKRDDSFCAKYNINKLDSIEEAFMARDIISLHMPLGPTTQNIVDQKIFDRCNSNLILINTARGNLVNEDDLRSFLTRNGNAAYLTDVLATEPMEANHPLGKMPNVFITPHIASRTIENVERQGLVAVENLIKGLGV